jgi:DNA-binding NarL/FixJ family response regulator
MCVHAGCDILSIGRFSCTQVRQQDRFVMSQAPSSPSDVSDYMVAIVAPAWLQGGLAVVVKSIPQVRLVACTGSVPIFLLLDLAREPDVIILAVEVPQAHASDQVRPVRFVYPHVRYLVLVQETAQFDSVRAAGADAILLQGASAEQFASEIRHLLEVIKSTRENHSL